MAGQDNSFGPLCEDLFLNIARRLSDKDLIKLKCISKECLRIISNVCVPILSAEAPVSGIYFRFSEIIIGSLPGVDSHSSQDAKDQLYHQLAYCDYINHIGSVPLTPCLDPPGKCFADGAVVSLGISYASMLPFNLSGPDFLDCCNGLVLLVQRPKPKFYVCNPAIGQCVPIPLPPPSIQFSSLYASLAFDPSESIHYKVVISSVTTQPQCLHIFYSETGQWMTHEVQIKPLTSSNCFQLVRHSVYLKGIVYRLSLWNKILCFDLKSLRTSVINCPSPDLPSNFKSSVPPLPGYIGVSNGCLSFIKLEEEHVYLWLLDNANESSEWNLKYQISFNHLYKRVKKKIRLGFGIWLQPYGFHPTSDIMFVGTGDTIMMYHILSGEVEVLQHFIQGDILGGCFFPIFTYKRSYVTLKNWCRGPCTRLENYADVQDDWCYIEQ